jgi:hypothetical protein
MISARMGINRLFNGYYPDVPIPLSLLRAPIWGLECFVLLWAYIGFRNRVGLVASADTAESSPPHSILTYRFLTLSVGLAIILAASASFMLDVSDSTFQSRLLPWIPPLIWIQAAGFTAASRLFPCQAEALNTGCEWYKWLPTFVMANALVYLPLASLAMLLSRTSERIHTLLPKHKHHLVRWSAAIVMMALFSRILIAKIWSLYTPGGYEDRFSWRMADATTGTVSLLGLLIPLYVLRAFLAHREERVTEQYVVDFAWLATVYACALDFADIYR